jgi:hypothetical protein
MKMGKRREFCDGLNEEGEEEEDELGHKLVHAPW